MIFNLVSSKSACFFNSVLFLHHGFYRFFWIYFKYIFFSDSLVISSSWCMFICFVLIWSLIVETCLHCRTVCVHVSRPVASMASAHFWQSFLSWGIPTPYGQCQFEYKSTCGTCARFWFLRETFLNPGPGRQGRASLWPEPTFHWEDSPSNSWASWAWCRGSLC